MKQAHNVSTAGKGVSLATTSIIMLIEGFIRCVVALVARVLVRSGAEAKRQIHNNCFRE